MNKPTRDDVDMALGFLILAGFISAGLGFVWLVDEVRLNPTGEIAEGVYAVLAIADLLLTIVMLILVALFIFGVLIAVATLIHARIAGVDEGDDASTS